MKTLSQIVRQALTPDQIALWESAKSLRTVEAPQGSLELLWADGIFQIERVSVHPNTPIPKHRHPNVASWEYLLKGNGLVCIKHRVISVENDIDTRLQFVPRNVWHVGHTNDLGAYWLSIQKWFSAPTSVAEDWDGNKI